MLQFISNLRIKIITLFLILNLIGFSYPCYSEQLLNHDISHNVSKLSPNGVSGITSVDLTKNRRSTRYIVSFGLDNKVAKKQILRLKVQYEELPYQGMNESNIYATYNFLF